MICARCGSSQEDSAGFCSDCGTPLAARAPAGDEPGGPVSGLPADATWPYQEGYEPARAAMFAPPPPPPPPSRASANPGIVLILIGAGTLVAAIVLQFLKVSAGGVSVSASQANGICSSTLGQFGQAISNGFGDRTLAAACGKAALIEDFKGAAIWLTIALMISGLALVAHHQGWGVPVTSRAGTR